MNFFNKKKLLQHIFFFPFPDALITHMQVRVYSLSQKYFCKLISSVNGFMLKREDLAEHN